MLCEEAGLGWIAIGKKLGIDNRRVYKVSAVADVLFSMMLRKWAQFRLK
jgi:hypothetical protein